MDRRHFGRREAGVSQHEESETVWEMDFPSRVRIVPSLRLRQDGGGASRRSPRQSGIAATGPGKGDCVMLSAASDRRGGGRTLQGA